MFKQLQYCTHLKWKVRLKIIQARLQQYVNRELPDVHAGFRKGWRTRDQIVNIRWTIEKAMSSRKTSTAALLTTPKPLTVWITTNCGKFWKRWEHQTILPTSWEICMQVNKQQLELDMEQQTGSKSGKEYVRGCILSPWLFNLYAEYIMRNTGLDEAQAEIKTAGRNINNLRYTDNTTLMTESYEELKSLLMKVKEESEKAGLKLNIKKTKIMASGPITSWQIDGETMETVTDYFWGAPKSLQVVTAAIKLNDACSSEEKVWPT